MASSGRLLEHIAQGEAAALREAFVEACSERRVGASDAQLTIGALLIAAYPGRRAYVLRHPEDVVAILRGGGARTPRDARAYRRMALGALAGLDEADSMRAALRRFAGREKLRIALRELLVHGGADVDVTARELSDLADVCIDLALSEALEHARRRFGECVHASGEPCAVTVLGMGKLGGRELNPGSDVDLLVFYESDDALVRQGGEERDISAHEYFTRVTQRMIATLDESTEAGAVWRVDMRLRPEGSRGPLVNAMSAAERYYETWGRTWERAALVRARPVAGSLRFGREALETLVPFVWRRAVDPRVAAEMASLIERARIELSRDVERDLKHGVGGIRDAEFFVQSLQLIWGGRDARLRDPNTISALRRLRARGLVTDREAREVGDGYLALRRLEHRVQNALELQTHELPTGPVLETLARSMGYQTGAELERDYAEIRRKVAARFASLSEELPKTMVDREHERFFAVLDTRDEEALRAALPDRFAAYRAPDLPRHLLALASRPDFPLGAVTRDRRPELAVEIVEAIAEAANSEQAARLLAAFFARLVVPSTYITAMVEDPRLVRRITGLFGASLFLGEALVNHPALFDSLLFSHGAPTVASARAVVDTEMSEAEARIAAGLPAEIDPLDAQVGALRRAKARVTMEVGLSDLSGELDVRACALVLSELADATLEHATRIALAEQGLSEGLAVIAMGKLGGRELGYGSDLDLVFVYDGKQGAEGVAERYIRAAQRVIRIVSTPHGAGPGYELDTRLRPSGQSGLLVVTFEGFARYHGRDESGARLEGERTAADWERQALVRARFAAGDGELGAAVLRIAHASAYEDGAAPADELWAMRRRMELELGRERHEEGRARYDLKVGRGGLVDVEFAVQWLQMRFGRDPRVRSTDTETALGALEACGYLSEAEADILRDGYAMLRRLEQALRVFHGTSAHLLEEGAPRLVTVARRMGLRDGPRGAATLGLLDRYLATTRDVRLAFLSVLGLPPEEASVR